MLKSIVVLICAAVQLGMADKPVSSPSLVASELSFARRCQEVGVRASFMEYFADDGIAFKPEPFRYTETVKTLPPQPNPKAIQLEWEPQFACIAASGELGFTTGPSVRTDLIAANKPKGYGQFFSVWKQQKDGKWRVAADIGTQMPSQSSPLGNPCNEPIKPKWPQASGGRSAQDRGATIMKLEREFSEACAAEGDMQAYLSRAEDSTRLHRENRLPIVGRKAIAAHLGKELHISSWSPMGSDVSLANDLGYTYGSYENKKSSVASAIEKGYYLHVWGKNSIGEWKLIADITNPLDDKNK
jgi:ketosteroid isomerase-like protein